MDTGMHEEKYSSEEEFTENRRDDEGSNNLEQCFTLLEKVENDPTNYELHLQCLKVLESSGSIMKNALNLERRKFQEQFPLSQDIWIRWLDDETRAMKVAQDEIDIEDGDSKNPLLSDWNQLDELYELSLNDYLSVPLWNNYLSFVVYRHKHVAPFLSTEDTRKIFERAVCNAGIHFTEGWMIWKTYRDFEKDILNEAMDIKSIDGDNKMKAFQIQEQRRRISNLYLRQLSIPLENNDVIMSEFRSWSEHNADPCSMDFVEKAAEAFTNLKSVTKKLEKREDQLQSHQYQQVDLLNDWLMFVEEDIRRDDMSRIIHTFERGLVSLCLAPNLWIKYIEYLMFTTKNIKLAKNVSQRSLRNISWSGILHAYSLLIEEHLDASFNQLKTIALNGLNGQLASPNDYLELGLAYCDCCRRHYSKLKTEKEEKDLREAFALVKEKLGTIVSNSSNTCLYKLLRYESFCETSLFQNRTRGNEIWEEIFSNYGSCLEPWSISINEARWGGDLNRCRELFRRSIDHVQDYPKFAMESWVEFERECGTFENWENAKYSCMKMEMKISHQTKLHVSLENNSSVEVEMENNSKKRKSSGVRNKPEKANQSKKTKREPQVQSKHQNLKTNTTLFVAKLEQSVTKEDLENLFSRCGECNVRLVTKKTGKSRGFAYIDYSKKEAADEGMLLNKTCLKGQEIEVQFSQPQDKSMDDKKVNDKKKDSVKWKNDSTTLYITGITEDLSKNVLEDYFSKFGQVVETLIMNDRRGRPKGYALVQFLDPDIQEHLLRDVKEVTINEKHLKLGVSRLSAIVMKEQQTKQRDKTLKKSNPKTNKGGDRKNTRRVNITLSDSTKTKEKLLVPASVGFVRPGSSNADFKKLFMTKPKKTEFREIE